MSNQRVGGIVTLLIGGAIELFNYYPTTRSIVDSLKKSGGTGALVADLFLSPLFGLAVLILGLLWIRPFYGSRHVPEESEPAQVANIKAPAITNTFSPSTTINQPSEQIVRLRYAETVDVVAFVGSEKRTQYEVPLDHLGRLIQVGPWDEDSVNMMVDRNPPLTVDQPRHDATYNMGGGYQAVFPGAGPGSGIRILDADFATSTEPSLLFHRFNCPKHRIDFPNRSFNVVLVRVHDSSTAKHKCIVYTFRVTEI
jgi:hypothetical protein